MRRIRAVAIIVNNEKVLLMHRINNRKEYHVFPGGGVENEKTVMFPASQNLATETKREI
jgi:ADP-ribose pyrophosphatase YjhB (NUDIX family)